MNSSRPYLIRALYEWIVDNSLTPYMLVDTGNSEVVVPLDFVEDGRIILNVSPDATHSLVLGKRPLMSMCLWVVCVQFMRVKTGKV